MAEPTSNAPGHGGKRPRLEVMVTPSMELNFAYLTKIDDKFKKYCCNGMIDLSNPLHVTFKGQLDDACRRLASALLAELPEAKRAYVAQNFQLSLPVKEEMKDFKPTGRLFIKPTANPDHPPTVVEVVNGAPVATTKCVFGGSKGQIKFLLNPYIHDANRKYGVSLLLEAVKVDTFAASSGGTGGKMSGFDTNADTQGSAAPASSGTEGAPPGTEEELPF